MGSNFYSNYSEVKFIDKLKRNIDTCKAFYFSVSFIKKPGLRLLAPNIEAPIDTTRSASSYPNFNMTQKYVQAAVDAGFDVFSLCMQFSRCDNGDEETRTLDPLLARQVLSQLSYIPNQQSAVSRCSAARPSVSSLHGLSRCDP